VTQNNFIDGGLLTGHQGVAALYRLLYRINFQRRGHDRQCNKQMNFVKITLSSLGYSV